MCRTAGSWVPGGGYGSRTSWGKGDERLLESRIYYDFWIFLDENFLATSHQHPPCSSSSSSCRMRLVGRLAAARRPLRASQSAPVLLPRDAKMVQRRRSAKRRGSNGCHCLGPQSTVQMTSHEQNQWRFSTATCLGWGESESWDTHQLI